MKRRNKILAVLAVACFGSVTAYLAWPREPSYHGRGLSAWLRDLEANHMPESLPF